MERTMQLQVPMGMLIDELAARLQSLLPVDRHQAMVERLGEACSIKTAAHEIEVSTATVARMLADGRLTPACEGSRVDVRSLADYIERRSEADREARTQKKRGKVYFT